MAGCTKVSSRLHLPMSARAKHCLPNRFSDLARSFQEKERPKKASIQNEATHKASTKLKLRIRKASHYLSSHRNQRHHAIGRLGRNGQKHPTPESPLHSKHHPHSIERQRLVHTVGIVEAKSAESHLFDLFEVAWLDSESHPTQVNEKTSFQRLHHTGQPCHKTRLK